MNIGAQVQEKREAILATAAKYGAYNVRIFGSVARGEADSGSDVDFLVEMEAERSLFDLGGLLMELQTLLDCPVDVVTEKGLRPRIHARILDEAIPL
ncbi:MAG: nucleotidyltransferase family protein [Kaiparowitsia implicata GSE-PSE-MK54-09C]|jgi:predicted nucleotidyltransferase|nr:nucleotidyltransferase family protein [Kaiparowitsia implicata GSE-PSE-MK54-09C]